MPRWSGALWSCCLLPAAGRHLFERCCQLPAGGMLHSLQCLQGVQQLSKGARGRRGLAVALLLALLCGLRRGCDGPAVIIAPTCPVALIATAARHLEWPRAAAHVEACSRAASGLPLKRPQPDVRQLGHHCLCCTSGCWAHWPGPAWAAGACSARGQAGARCCGCCGACIRTYRRCCAKRLLSRCCAPCRRCCRRTHIAARAAAKGGGVLPHRVQPGHALPCHRRRPWLCRGLARCRSWPCLAASSSSSLLQQLREARRQRCASSTC